MGWMQALGISILIVMAAIYKGTSPNGTIMDGPIGGGFWD